MERSLFEIEICAGNIQSVIEAERGGANRVELCENLYEGGTTPSIGTITLAKEKTDLDIFPIIRPRAGDFVFSQLELEVMLHDIESALNVGVDGIVIGCLTRENSIDYDMCARLIEAAKGLPITFHRAFDIIPGPFKALNTLKSLGVHRILTSGQRNKAIDGLSLLKELVIQSGEEIKIMVGSGVNEENIVQIATETNARAFHASLREEVSSGIPPHPEVRFMNSSEMNENSHKITSRERLNKLIKNLEEL